MSKRRVSGSERPAEPEGPPASKVRKPQQPPGPPPGHQAKPAPVIPKAAKTTGPQQSRGPPHLPKGPPPQKRQAPKPEVATAMPVLIEFASTKGAQERLRDKGLCQGRGRAASSQATAQPVEPEQETWATPASHRTCETQAKSKGTKGSPTEDADTFSRGGQR